MASGVAYVAYRLGIRKFLAKDARTVNTSPIIPIPETGIAVLE